MALSRLLLAPRKDRRRRRRRGRAIVATRALHNSPISIISDPDRIE